MNAEFNAHLFDAHYYASGLGLPYERNDAWLAFFGGIAERVRQDIQPRTVLDAGCALGFLVEGLRQRGMEAFGVDISEYAIEHVHRDIQPYCWRGSITDPFPMHYDLIVSIEVLEHLPPPDGNTAIANLCRHTDDILFSSTPFDYKEATHVNVQPPETWAELFARHGFYRDVDFDASFLTQWATRYRRRHEPVHRIVRDYERRFWLLNKENLDLRALVLENRTQLSAAHEAVEQRPRLLQQLQQAQVAPRSVQEEAQRQKIRALQAQLAEKEQAERTLSSRLRETEARRVQLENSIGWGVLRRLQTLRARVAPPASRRDRLIDQAARKFRQPGRARVRAGLDSQPSAGLSAELTPVPPVACPGPVAPHRATVDIIVCVHNALAEVQKCLVSLTRESPGPCHLIVVDDGSGEETAAFLRQFAAEHACLLLRSDEATGYTRAANRGLRAATADFLILLNSDTVVTSGWLDRLVGCAASDPAIGLAGPLSNTASWQSIPELFDAAGDWATNPLPAGQTLATFSDALALHAGRVYPRVPLLNGFCLLIRRAVIDQIGYFDEQAFGAGYGEENDYCLRARQAGWQLAVADDAYVFHAQGKSYTDERRRSLSDSANRILAEKHGQQIVTESCDVWRGDRVVEGIRARAQVLAAREACIAEGHAAFAGRHLLFVLPVSEPGGGTNIIINEARAICRMGAEVSLFNAKIHRPFFTRGYPELELPVIYGNPKDLPAIARQFDAVIATVNYTVEWLEGITRRSGRPVVKGYYVQDFEPLFYPPGTSDYRRAWDSYTHFPDLVRFTQTEWNRQEVRTKTGAECARLGPILDIDMFRPRMRPGPEPPDRPLRVAAMIRPSTPRRAPALTMAVLRRIARRYGSDVDIRIFGVAPDDPTLAALPTDFSWRTAGILRQEQVVSFINDIDIFVDFSSHQAMGMTTLEAMASGAAVIAPRCGGSVEFACDGINSLVVDSTSEDDCAEALESLVEDYELRRRLQRQAIYDACRCFHERPALNILKALFGPHGNQAA